MVAVVVDETYPDHPHDDDATPHPLPLAQWLPRSLVSAASFWALDTVTKNVLAPRFLGRAIAGWDADRVALLLGHGPSVVHAAASSCLLLKAFTHPTLGGLKLFRDMEFGELPGREVLLPLSLGYFLFDTASLLGYYLRHDRSMIGHHVASIVACTITSHWGVAQPFMVLALLAEPNSVFLHIRKVMRMLGAHKAAKPGLLYRAVVTANLVTFLLARIVVHGGGLLLTFRTLWRPKLHVLFSLFGISGGALTFWLNLGLLRAILRADYGLALRRAARA